MDNKRYNWQHPDWPKFTYDLADMRNLIRHYLLESGLLFGRIEQLSEEMQREAVIDRMVNEAQKSSKIEGEKIDYEDIRSSIRKELGIPTLHKIKDARAIGIAKLMVSVRQTFDQPLTEKRLFDWHAMVMNGLKPHSHVDVGKYRTGKEPMQIISGAMGREIVHFGAPPSEIVPKEMKKFICWFNFSAKQIPGVVHAAISHLYFESIHPFDDGNGRIGRAIAEKALAEELGRPILFSLSAIIEPKKKKYYQELSSASRCDLEITPWINYFLKTILASQEEAKKKIDFAINKSKFWKKFQSTLNERQEKVLMRMFEAGPKGFIGGINAHKYMSITKCSKATATRDLAQLVQLGCLMRSKSGGRSTGYILKY